MSYHDYRHHTAEWLKSETVQDTTQPALQIISPQKKLFDIQQLINSLPESPMTMFELQERIQKILDGVV